LLRGLVAYRVKDRVAGAGVLEAPPHPAGNEEDVVALPDERAAGDLDLALPVENAIDGASKVCR
jgi:hypothetical protein